MGNLNLVRHGQASLGASDYDQLSPRGRTQSELLGRWLATIGSRPGRVICGALKRHRQTAEACLGAWRPNDQKLAPVENSVFDEFDHQEVLIRAQPQFAEPGRLEHFIAEQPDGRRAFQAMFAESMARWIGGRHDEDYSESWNAFRARCFAGLLAVAEETQAGDVWIFTSGGPIAAIIQQVLRIPDDQTLDINWSVKNSSVSEFSFLGGRPRLTQFNSVAHLAVAGGGELVSYR